MRINWSKNTTIVNQLMSVVKSTLPTIEATGLNKNLGIVKADPKGKGKSVLFVWRKATLRVTEALVVMEVNFCNTLEKTEAAKEAEAMLMAGVSGAAQVI